MVLAGRKRVARACICLGSGEDDGAGANASGDSGREDDDGNGLKDVGDGWTRSDLGGNDPPSGRLR